MLGQECSILIKNDLCRYGKKFSKAHFLSIFISHPGFRFLVVSRLANYYLRNHLLGFIARLWYRNLRTKYGMQISFKAIIGAGFRLNHWGPMHINQNVTIGKNCNISQGVTIGNVSRGKLQGTPILGDEVWIGANAIIVGKIKIGNNVLIAPLSYVNFDVPDNSVVMGNPAKIVSQGGAGGYIKNRC